MNLTIMDYNYIKQLLERYWACETTVEEESILRAFFSQKTVPAELAQYQPLFVYQATEPKDDVLGEDFDAHIMAMIEEPVQVKARVIPMTQRLKPLFKAAAVVAIVLTLSNAFQMSFDSNSPVANGSGGYNYDHIQQMHAVAKADSAVIDTAQQATIQSSTSYTSPMLDR